MRNFFETHTAHEIALHLCRHFGRPHSTIRTMVASGHTVPYKATHNWGVNNALNG